jgi:hypothetical protein
MNSQDTKFAVIAFLGAIGLWALAYGIAQGIVNANFALGLNAGELGLIGFLVFMVFLYEVIKDMF